MIHPFLLLLFSETASLMQIPEADTSIKYSSFACKLHTPQTSEDHHVEICKNHYLSRPYKENGS